MKDSDIEDLVRRYRPIGPSAQLRERILATGPIQRIWPWASAAAVLLVSALTFRVAAGHKVASADVRVGPADAVRIADELTGMLGGGADARELAEFILIEQQLRREAPGEEPQ